MFDLVLKSTKDEKPEVSKYGVLKKVNERDGKYIRQTKIMISTRFNYNIAAYICICFNKNSIDNYRICSL